MSLATPGRLSWLLHAEKHLSWDDASGTAKIRGLEGKAALTAKLIAAGTTLRGHVTNEFPVPVDPKYTNRGSSAFITGTWHNHAHLAAESAESAKEFTVYAILWPERGSAAPIVSASVDASGALFIQRPDGRKDTLTLSDSACVVK